MAACADQPTAVGTPTFNPNVASRVQVGSVVGGPDLGDWRNFQGEVWICKDGNVAGVPFDIDYTVVRQSDNTLVASGTATVPVGQCVMAANVSTEIGGRYVATATEQVPPADWALTAIDWAYGANIPVNPAPPTIDLATRTISAVLISNDFGIQLTFTNTYTPPPPPPPPGPSCTYTQGYWKNHPSDWDSASDGKLFTTTTVFYNSGVTYLSLMKTAPKGGNAYIQLAHQFIAASLNLNGAPSGDASVDAAIAGGAAYFASAGAGTPAPSGALRTQVQAWATTLDNYNNGLLGPGHCD